MARSSILYQMTLSLIILAFSSISLGEMTSDSCSVDPVAERVFTKLTVEFEKADVPGRFQIQSEIIQDLDALAESVFNRFLHKAPNVSVWTKNIQSCLSRFPSLNNKLVYSLNKKIANWLFTKMRNSHSEKMRALAGIFNSGSRNLKFNTFSWLQQNEFFQEKGGYQFFQNWIFLDLERVSPEELLFVFVHELAHELDSTLKSNLDIFNDYKVAEIIYSTQNLTPANLDRIDHWLQASLQIHFLAEWRAWLFTYEIYRDIINLDHIQPVDWLEKKIPHVSNLPAELLASTVFNYLDKKFYDPTNEYPFDIPILKERLLFLRENLRKSHNPLQQDPCLANLTERTCPSEN
ncbi:MAG: hypothetical protein ACXWRE_12160 [Pseudobdellovibrionaceae bacterium]